MALNKKNKLYVSLGVIIIASSFTLLTLNNKEQNIVPTNIAPDEEKIKPNDISSTDLLNEIAQNENISNNHHSHNHAADDNNIPKEDAQNNKLSVMDNYKNYMFSDYEEAIHFPSNTYNTLGKIVHFAYGEHLLVSDGDYSLYLVNSSNKKITKLSNNFVSFKKKSNHELIFTIQSEQNLYSFYYIDLKVDEPKAYSFYEIPSTPYSNKYQITDDYFILETNKSEFSFIPYTINYNQLQIDHLSPIEIIESSPLFTNHNEIYGYVGTTAVQFMKLTDTFETFKTNFSDFKHDNTIYYAIDANYNPSRNDAYYIGAPIKDSEYGTVFYKNKALPSLIGVSTEWLNDTTIIDLTVDGQLILFDTKTQKTSVISTGLDSFYIDKENKIVYATNFYADSVVSFTYDFK